MDCIFCKIVKKELPAKFLYEDEDVVVFPDINPVKPVHIIIIPKDHISELIAVENPEIFQKLFKVVQKMVEEQGLKDKGYRVVINGGGAQLVHHLHIHLMGPIKNTATL
jgi:histidine triad (HIT) family protein